MKTAIAIPARWKSVRFLGKMLADLCGKPVIQHVYEAAVASGIADEVFILVDSDEVANVTKKFCENVLMTSPNCTCGTDRIASVVDRIDADWIVNVQGDEPLINIETLQRVHQKTLESSADIVTPVYKITNQSDLLASSCVKVAIAGDGHAVYFSRSPIPFIRDIEQSKWLDNLTFYGHIGVYAYRKSVLKNYRNLSKSPLEAAESLEQLRFLDNGYKIDTVLVKHSSIGIDTPQDLERATKILKNS